MIALEPLLSLFPPSLLEDLAVTHRVDSRHEIRLPGPVAFVCLLNGLVNHPALTQRLLEEQYVKLTGKHADFTTFSKYLTRANVSYFKEIFAFLYDKLADKATQGDRTALRVRFVDATIVTLSAKLLTFGLVSGTRKADGQRRQVKGVFTLSDDGLPDLLRLCREKSEASDCVALGRTMEQATVPGDFWVFDKGCHSRERLLNLHTAGSFFLTPHSQQSCRVLRLIHETRPDIQPDVLPPPKDLKDKETFRLVRVEEVVFENSYKTERAKRLQTMPVVLLHGLRFDQTSKQWKPLVLMTNLPLSQEGTHAGPYTFLELAELYRRRWDIETFFKFLKQNLGYRHLTSRNENGITVFIYMSLISTLLLTWYKRVTGIDRGWKSVKFWFAEDTREWTLVALQNIQLLSG